jgi:hypothetical protein
MLLAVTKFFFLNSHTIVDELELRDDVQSDVGELIFKHLQEHGKEMLNGPMRVSGGTWSRA